MVIQSDWSTVKLDELNQEAMPICYGVLKPGEPSPDGIPMLRVKDISSNMLDLSDVLNISRQLDTEFSRSRLSGNEILISVQGTVGRVVLADSRVKNFNISRTIAKITLVDDVCRRFIRYYLLSPYGANSIGEQSGGTTRASLNIGDLRDLIVPIPPLAEQKAIADKLDTLLAQVETTKARLERIPEILKSFRQSVLTAAVTGKLTKGWASHNQDYYVEIDAEIFLDPKLKKLDMLSMDETNQARILFDNPEWGKWRLYPLELLVESKRGIPYGIVQTGEARQEGIRTIRCGDVKPLAVHTRELKLVSPEIESQYSRTRLQGNEVILAIRGTVGNAAVITKDMVEQPLNISREVAMIPVRSNINPYFISFLLQSPGGYRCLAEKTKGVAQQGINLADVKRLVTPLPPLDEQTEIVRRVEQLFAFADSIEQKANAALARVNNLTQSILAKAFRGELTADWRAANPDLITGDNSAEALLAKIKAERAKLAKKTKAKA